MKYWAISSPIIAILLAVVNCLTINKLASSNPSNANDIKFTCGQYYDQEKTEYRFATFAWSAANKRPLIVWDREDFSGNGFDPKKRCELVSPQFQVAYDDDSLNLITSGFINEQPVICTSRKVGEECETLLLTLLHKDNAVKTLEKFSEILLDPSGRPVDQSSGDIHIVGDRVYVEIDIEKFLRE